VSALAEGTNDPLFHPQGPMRAQADKQLATAAVSGRIGANPLGLVEAYRPQLNALEAVLQSCAPGVNCVAAAPLKSLFDLPSSIAPGKDRQIVDLRTPLGPAATMAENMLLEYAEGMDAANVGWGQVDLNKLRELVQLHTAHVDVAQRVPYIARMQSSNMLAHVLESMQQAVGKKPVAGALSKQDDRLLVLSGHDTNVAAIAASLGLSWVVDGRRDDTPPGGALVFELWKRRGAESYSVRTYYQAQTLDQMRNATPLTLANPPERLPVFVPGCGEADGSCGWDGFQHTVGAAIDSTFVK
jgi:4-phytase/acid phosphatase